MNERLQRGTVFILFAQAAIETRLLKRKPGCATVHLSLRHIVQIYLCTAPAHFLVHTI